MWDRLLVGGGALALHYLERGEECCRGTGTWPALVEGSGCSETPSDWSLSGECDEYPAVVEEGGYAAQGCTSGGVTLTELRPERPVQSGLIRTIYSNQSGFGANNGAEIDGEIVNINKGVSFDVTYSG